MDGERHSLPRGWDASIPEHAWPSALISAVRRDLSALGSPRVIETIRRWRSDAHGATSAADRARAHRNLAELAHAIRGERSENQSPPVFSTDAQDTLLPHASRPDSGADAMALPPRPNLRRRTVQDRGEEASERNRRGRVNPRASRRPPSRRPSDDWDTDSQVIAHSTTGASRPPEPDFDDENPVTALLHPLDRPPSIGPASSRVEEGGRAESGGLQRRRPSSRSTGAARPQGSGFEEDEKPTRHIALPEEVLLKRLDSAEAALAQEEERGAERTEMARHPPKPEPAPPGRGPTPRIPIHPGEAGPPEAEPPVGRGEVRRSSVPRSPPPPPRPRAAMHHVRALHALLHEFVEELTPLSYGRRSKRFWARWREVAGDRGVRREFVEELLETAEDGRTLLCELIAEVQSVDPGSVYALVARLSEPVPTQPRGGGARLGESLVGASVQMDPDEG